MFVFSVRAGGGRSGQLQLRGSEERRSHMLHEFGHPAAVPSARHQRSPTRHRRRGRWRRNALLPVPDGHGTSAGTSQPILFLLHIHVGCKSILIVPVCRVGIETSILRAGEVLALSASTRSACQRPRAAGFVRVLHAPGGQHRRAPVQDRAREALPQFAGRRLQRPDDLQGVSPSLRKGADLPRLEFDRQESQSGRLPGAVRQRRTPRGR